MLSHIRLPAGLAALAATAYLLLMNADIGFAAHTILKGSAVAILALAAAAAARSTDGWLLAAVMALGAAGDVLIEFTLIAGAAVIGALSVSAFDIRYSPFDIPFRLCPCRCAWASMGGVSTRFITGI